MSETVSIVVFLDSGLQKFFVPLRKPNNFSSLPKNSKVPSSLNEALESIKAYDELIPEETKQLLDELFSGTSRNALFLLPVSARQGWPKNMALGSRTRNIAERTLDHG